MGKYLHVVLFVFRSAIVILITDLYSMLFLNITLLLTFLIRLSSNNMLVMLNVVALFNLVLITEFNVLMFLIWCYKNTVQTCCMSTCCIVDSISILMYSIFVKIKKKEEIFSNVVVVKQMCKMFDLKVVNILMTFSKCILIHLLVIC